MGRRNTFSRALKQLKSEEIDKKIQLIEALPTNNTMGVFSTAPDGYEVGTTTVQRTSWDEAQLDFDADGQSDGKDTTGLFETDGTPKTAMPPGDTSYILGPMAAMYYGWWSGGTTTVGYIRQSDRKMVNLGTISGKLHEWDGASFNSYGQLTLEQAQWFKDVKKKDDAGNDPANANYRAFYPGPPSNTPDAFGRYYCTVTGEPLNRSVTSNVEVPHSPTEKGTWDPGDAWSAIMDRLKGWAKDGILPTNITKTIDKSLKDELEYLTKPLHERLFDDVKGLLKGVGFGIGLVHGSSMTFGSFLNANSIGKTDSGEEFLRGGIEPYIGRTDNTVQHAAGLALNLIRSMATGKTVVTNDENISDNLRKQLGNSLTSSDLNSILNDGFSLKPPDTLPTDANSILNPTNKREYRNGGAGGEGGSIIRAGLDREGNPVLFETSDKFTRISNKAGGGFDLSKLQYADVPQPSESTLKGMVEKVLNSGLIEHAGAFGTMIQDRINNSSSQLGGLGSRGGSGNQNMSYKQALEKSKEVVENDDFRKLAGSVVTNPVVSEGLTSLGSGNVNGTVTGALVTSKVLEVLGLKQQSELEKSGASGHNRRNTTIKLSDLKPEQQKIYLDYLNNNGIEYNTSSKWNPNKDEKIAYDPNKGTTVNLKHQFGAGGDSGATEVDLRHKGSEIYKYNRGEFQDPKNLDNVDSEIKTNLDKELKKFNLTKKDKNKSKNKNKMRVTHYEPQGELIKDTYTFCSNVPLLESKKASRVLKNLKKPVVIPDTKQKKYKVKPGARMRGMDTLVGDVKPQEPYKKPQKVWTRGKNSQNYNARESQEKKNQVLQYVGASMDHWDYMTETLRKQGAKLATNYKDHDYLYDYWLGGKKNKITRKEEVDGDFLVFMEDENGKKTTILQSKLNAQVAQNKEKEAFDEYYKLNPKKEPIPYENDPLFKRVSKRLKTVIDYEGKPATKGYPNEPPPKQIDGWHPDFGKRYKYDKLDPVSAKAMPKTGNPEIDANVEKAARKPK